MVRVSPFDSSGRRHTSFASIEVMPEFADVDKVELKDEDLEPEIEKIVLAEEIKSRNPAVLEQIEKLFEGQTIDVEYVSHVELKAQTHHCKAVIRTGETTPYANIILQAGCIFA